jgi:hypothetical protein
MFTINKMAFRAASIPSAFWLDRVYRREQMRYDVSRHDKRKKYHY